MPSTEPEEDDSIFESDWDIIDTPPPPLVFEPKPPEPFDPTKPITPEVLGQLPPPPQFTAGGLSYAETEAIYNNMTGGQSSNFDQPAPAPAKPPSMLDSPYLSEEALKSLKAMKTGPVAYAEASAVYAKTYAVLTQPAKPKKSFHGISTSAALKPHFYEPKPKHWIVPNIDIAPRTWDVLMFNIGITLDVAGPKHMQKSLEGVVPSIKPYDHNYANNIFLPNFFVIYPMWLKDFFAYMGFAGDKKTRCDKFCEAISQCRNHHGVPAWTCLYRWVNDDGSEDGPDADLKAQKKKFSQEMMSIHAKPLPLP